MKNVIFSFMLCLAFPGFAQKPIKGKGEVKTKNFSIEQFTKLEVNFGGTVVVECGKMPMLQIKTNENIFQFIDVVEDKQTLRISSDKWIENTFREIRIQVPFLLEYDHSGWGTVQIIGLDNKSFVVTSSSGTIKLTGLVEQLKVNNTGSGNIQLDGLENRFLEVDQEGSGSLNVNTSDTVLILRNEGRITYSGHPIIIDQTTNKASTSVKIPATSSQVQYIKTKVRNNSALKRDFYIQGPNSAKFSYGFTLLPGFSRAENAPVGTKIYLVNKLGVRTELLVEFKAEDDQSTLLLFNK